MFENTKRIAGCIGRVEDRDPTYRSVLLSSSSQLPPAEPAWSNLAVVQERLTNVPNVLFPIDGNDKWGDCTVAGISHYITMQAGLAGQTVVPDAKTIIATYFKLTGGRDYGLNLSDVLTYYQKTGDIKASAEIDPTNWDLVKQAIQFFGGVYIGMKVPTNAQQQFNAGVPWTGGTLGRGGHCVVITGYNSDGGGELLTWGNKQEFTKAWYDQCVDEVQIAITEYTAKYTNRDLSGLIADCKAMGS